MIIREKGGTEPNQILNQPTNQPESQPLGSLPRPMNIYGNVRKRATVENQLYLVLQAGVFKHQ